MTESVSTRETKSAVTWFEVPKSESKEIPKVIDETHATVEFRRMDHNGGYPDELRMYYIAMRGARFPRDENYLQYKCHVKI